MKSGTTARTWRAKKKNGPITCKEMFRRPIKEIIERMRWLGRIDAMRRAGGDPRELKIPFRDIAGYVARSHHITKKVHRMVKWEAEERAQKRKAARA